MNKAIELKPDYTEAQALLGTVLESKNRPAQAIEHYRLALAAQPAYRPARLRLAQTLVSLGRYREAIPELRLALQVDDTDTSMTMVFLAEAYAATGDVGRAREYLRLAHTRVQQTGPPDLLQTIEEGLRQLGSLP